MIQAKYRFARLDDEDILLESDQDEDIVLDVRAATETQSVKLRRILILATELDNLHPPHGQTGETVRLIRKPDFPKDRWAIRVQDNQGGFLGYIPKEKNQSAARLMDAGKRISGEILEDRRIGIYLETQVKVKEKDDP